MGITTLNDPPEHYGLSLVLGGGGVKLAEMVHAYTVFNQEGLFHPQTSILEIKDKNNQTLEEFSLQSESVLDPQIARFITDILSDNIARAPTFGWNSPLYFENFQAAAKTGTDSEYRDAWTIGYTTSLASGVWAGNNDRSVVSQTGAPGSMLAAPCWHEFMEKAMEFYPPSNFVKPLPYTNDQEIKSSIPMLNGKYVNAVEYQNINTKETVTINEIHNILYYVNKNDVLSSPAENPSNDSQFEIWELPVLLWAQQNILNFNQEYNRHPGPGYVAIHNDSEESLINLPAALAIEFLFPENGYFADSNFSLSVRIQGNAEITNTKIYLNDYLLGNLYPSGASGEYYYPINLGSLTTQNEIKIEATDSLNHTASSTLIIFKR